MCNPLNLSTDRTKARKKLPREIFSMFLMKLVRLMNLNRIRTENDKYR